MADQNLIIKDPRTGTSYRRGKFLGKGGFARCYEFSVVGEQRSFFACKIVPTELLRKEHQRQKMTQEIRIHQQLNHENVVGFIANWEDPSHVYILLELCRRRSLMELHKRRQRVTEIECRYFVKEICKGVTYLHDKNVIHRDLKLGNVFLDDAMKVKIGDFGLATTVTDVADRKRTLCGTPNYIAPEILQKIGHSFEVDAWSIGCIMYTLLEGRPPFETSSLRETYSRIKQGQFNIYFKSEKARNLIGRLLCTDPNKRPILRTVPPFTNNSCYNILEDDWFKEYTPSELPLSCLTTAPRFDMNQSYVDFNSLQDENVHRPPGVAVAGEAGIPSDYGICRLKECLSRINTAAVVVNYENFLDDALDPAALPIYWISKWVDYSDKYGLGYQLCDGSSGVLFNDLTRIILQSNNTNLYYIERNGREVYLHLGRDEVPKEMNKKVTLLSYFRTYMTEHLLEAGAQAVRPADDLARLPFLRTWFRTRSAMILHLSNGTLQVNFFEDHIKVVLCPLMMAVTFLMPDQTEKTYSLNSLLKIKKLTPLLRDKLQYALTILIRLNDMRLSSATARGNDAGNA